MVRRDGVSFFESDIVIRSAKGISGRRDCRRCSALSNRSASSPGVAELLHMLRRDTIIIGGGATNRGVSHPLPRNLSLPRRRCVQSAGATTMRSRRTGPVLAPRDTPNAERRPGARGSHMIHRWREMDSNPRSPMGQDPMLERIAAQCRFCFGTPHRIFTWSLQRAWSHRCRLADCLPRTGCSRSMPLSCALTTPSQGRSRLVALAFIRRFRPAMFPRNGHTRGMDHVRLDLARLEPARRSPPKRHFPLPLARPNRVRCRLLYGAFSVKRLFWVCCQFFVRSGKAVLRAGSTSPPPGTISRIGIRIGILEI
jgi:hypothetical protein